MHLLYHQWRNTHPLEAYTFGTPDYYMRLSFELAEQGWFTARPNPMVGCVLVHEPTGQVVGQGAHLIYGQAHAETHAIADFRSGPYRQLPPRELTAYVTLEPCAHIGKTPPCCEALVALGVGAVVVAQPDPNPRVAGSGLAYLQAAGVSVHVLDIFQPVHERLNAPFLWGCEHTHPYLVHKVAQTLDGAVATREGHSQWITGPEAQAWVHTQRGGYDAVLSTADTVLTDASRLTVRHAPWDYKQQGGHPPIRIIIDRRFRLGASDFCDHPVLQTAEAPTWLCVDDAILATVQGQERQKALETRGVQCVPYPAFNAKALPQLMETLYARNIRACWVESGPRFATALYAHALIRETYVLVGPKTLRDPLGQQGAWPEMSSTTPTPVLMPGIPDFTLNAVDRLQQDALLHYTPLYG
jgi:diaminohydroxyphosphoribosylaminopyrimidine deaminase / 5-amino-6-(5-phosphoribosylamino)uracil reductase